MTKYEPCIVCGNDYQVAWADTHGVAQCIHCGAPYRIIHYEPDDEGDPKRVDKPAEIVLNQSDIDRCKRFHAETGGKLSAVGMGLSFPGGYDVATEADAEEWNDWVKGQP